MLRNISGFLSCKISQNIYIKFLKTINTPLKRLGEGEEERKKEGELEMASCGGGDWLRCRVHRIPTLYPSFHPNPNDKHVEVKVYYDGMQTPVVYRGDYPLYLRSLEENPHQEIRGLLCFAGMPVSLGSEEGLLDRIATGILNVVAESTKGEGLEIVTIHVEITSKEVEEVEKVYNCSLCGKDIVDEEDEEPDCGHVFHQDCMFDWLLENDTCPTCGYEIDIG